MMIPEDFESWLNKDASRLPQAWPKNADDPFAVPHASDQPEYAEWTAAVFTPGLKAARPPGRFSAIDDLVAAVDAVGTCGTVCEGTATECMRGADARRLSKAILACHECADVCDAAGRSLARMGDDQLPNLPHVLQRCIDACLRCAWVCAQSHDVRVLKICSAYCHRTAGALHGLGLQACCQ